MKAKDRATAVIKITKSTVICTIFLLLTALNANADFNIFLQNKLGADREVTYLFSEITTDTGAVLGNPGHFSSPLAPNKLLRIGTNVSSDSLNLLSLMVIEYQCISNPNSTDCWSYDPDFLSFPNGPLSCELSQDILETIDIDTSDKIVSGSGTTGQANYETRQVRIVLNEDFTVSYRVLRRNSVTGIYGRTEENVTVINNGVACKLTTI